LCPPPTITTSYALRRVRDPLTRSMLTGDDHCRVMPGGVPELDAAGGESIDGTG
jgi:hypothetical protein